jgi:hypothetical protein
VATFLAGAVLFFVATFFVVFALLADVVECLTVVAFADGCAAGVAAIAVAGARSTTERPSANFVMLDFIAILSRKLKKG